MSKRRDNKGRILRSGESRKKNGRYVYQYTDFTGKRRCIYSNRLEKTDSYPDDSRKRELSLREKEKEIKDSVTLDIYTHLKIDDAREELENLKKQGKLA